MCLYCIQQSNNFRVNNPCIKHKYIKTCLNGKQNKNRSAVTGTFVLEEEEEEEEKEEGKKHPT